MSEPVVHGEQLAAQVAEQALGALQLGVDHADAVQDIPVTVELAPPPLQRGLERRPQRRVLGKPGEVPLEALDALGDPTPVPALQQPTQEPPPPPAPPH